MSSANGWAYSTPTFAPTDPVVCRSLQLRPSLWAVVFNELQRLGYEWSWRQDDPAAATPAEVAAEIIAATDQAVFWGCTMLGDVKWIARSPAAFELVCDGSSYDRVDYPELYAVLDAAYIIDADTFRTPDLIDRVARGSLTPGAAAGSDSVTLTVGQLPPHTHQYDQIAATFIDPGITPSVIGIDDINPAATSSTGSGDPISIIPAHETLIPVIVAAYPVAG